MTELVPGAVTVGDLYREIVGMRSDVVKALTRIEAIDTVNANADQVHRDHETRLRILESFRWKVAGGAILLGGVAGAASAWVGIISARR